MSSHISEQQQIILTLFREISHINDEYLCIQILQQNSWDLDRAINSFIHNEEVEGRPRETGTSTPTSRADEQRSGYARDRGTDNNVNTSTLSRRDIDNVMQESPVLSILFQPIRWLFQSRPVSLNPNADTVKFIDEFNQNYSTIHPNFYPHSYQSAVAHAFASSKFLLVYLHSPIHDDSNKFCRQTLSSESFIALSNQYAVSWAGKIWDAEAYGLSLQLKASSFPFVALLICQSNRSVQIAEKIQGFVDEREFVTRLQTAMNNFNNIINMNRLEASRREDSIRLREQQDREYLDSAETDRQIENRRRQELEEQAQQEEKKQQEEELARAVEMSKELTYADTIRKKREYLQANPEPEQGPDVATVRFQLPKGAKLSRRFKKSDNAQVIFDFLFIHFADSGDKITNFSVSTHFPKVEVTDMNETIASLSLHPRGMLYVQDLDA